MTRLVMTRRVRRLAVHFDSSWCWIGVCVLEQWIVVQPVPCIGVTFRRRGLRPGDLVVYPPAA